MQAFTMVIGLAISATAIGGILGTTPSAPSSANMPAERKAAPSSYLLRCWQYGRLILEEQYLLRPESVDMKAARLKVTDQRANQPIYLTETSNATCLIRPRAADRERPTGE
jgi:hypothetical protein